MKGLSDNILTEVIGMVHVNSWQISMNPAEPGAVPTVSEVPISAPQPITSVDYAKKWRTIIVRRMIILFIPSLFYLDVFYRFLFASYIIIGKVPRIHNGDSAPISNAFIFCLGASGALWVTLPGHLQG